MANNSPKLNIVLFNTDSSDTGTRANATNRYLCMDVILDTVIKENYPNLFILAQDKIGRLTKHDKLREKLHQNHIFVPFKKEAGVYYDTETNTHCDVEYVNDVDLQHADSDLPDKEDDNHFAVSRLTACVLRPKPGIEMCKILLVSWHGPCTPRGSLGIPGRKACFQRLVGFLDLLKDQKGCDMVIVGGDFNLPSWEARNLLGGVGRALLDNYTPTLDRPDGDLIDYVVYWPRDGFLDIEIAVLCPDLRGAEHNRPFDHNILLYRFGGPFSDLARQFASITVYDDEEESDDAEDEEGSDNAEDEEGINDAAD